MLKTLLLNKTVAINNTNVCWKRQTFEHYGRKIPNYVDGVVFHHMRLRHASGDRVIGPDYLQHRSHKWEFRTFLYKKKAMQKKCRNGLRRLYYSSFKVNMLRFIFPTPNSQIK